MNLIQKLKQIILCGGIEESAYRQIESEIRSSNRIIVKTFSLFAAVMLAIMFIASFAVDSLSTYRVLYGVSFAIALVIWVTSTFFAKRNSALILFDVYIFAAMLLGMGIVLGTFLSPKEISATYIALLLAVPQVFTDRPYRMYLLIIASVTAFIIITLNVKVPAAINSDITNAIVFGLVSIVLTTYSIRTRVSRYYLEAKIKFLAEKDQLTGLRNRYCYERSLEEVSVLGSKSIYCVYVDVNGLHELNDTQGHEAGDRMLQYIASVMKHQFGEDETFRIGGDEFVALGLDKSRKEIEENVVTMKQAIESAGYHVAAGISYREQKEIAVGSLVKDAEKQMYEDKANYYQQNGIDRRKR